MILLCCRCFFCDSIQFINYKAIPYVVAAHVVLVHFIGLGYSFDFNDWDRIRGPRFIDSTQSLYPLQIPISSIS